MRRSVNPVLAACLQFIAAAVGFLCSTRDIAAQQPGPIGFRFGFDSPAPIELSPPRVELISGAIAARLEQARASAAQKNWDEAVDTLRDLSAEGSGRVVVLDEHRYVTVRTYCQMQLARLPAEGLAAYRRRVDPQAEQWYLQGVAKRDENLLRRVVDELFCSSWGDDALLALGELALERADYAAARRWWEQISPLLRDPAGRPVWFALRAIDVNANWPDIERQWQNRSQPLDWLAYSDTQLNLADVRARLILVSIRAGELDRARLELAVFRHLHSSASGRLGGQNGNYVAVLEHLISSAANWPSELPDDQWPTFAGAASRGPAIPPLRPIAGPLWNAAVEFSPVEQGDLPATGISFDHVNGPRAGEPSRPLSCFPVVVDRHVLFADALGIHAVNLADGRPEFTRDGRLYTEESFKQTPRGAFLTAAGAITHGQAIYTLTVDKQTAYGRVGRPITAQLEASQTAASDRIIGLDLSREGLLAFRARPEEDSSSFDGVPVCRENRVFVPLRHSDVTPQTFVACFDAATGGQLWRTAIGAADTPGSIRGEEITHNLLTLSDNQIYFNTNMGLVAALDADNGHICWIHRYDRYSGKEQGSGLREPPCFERMPSSCVYYDGLVIVAPSDTPAVFALDAETGKMLWINNEMPDGLHLIGVARQNLVVDGPRLRLVDLYSGVVRFVWPDSETAGARGRGRGMVAGEEVFWPTRNEIIVMSAVSGQRTRPPISLSPLGGDGANLAAAHGCLIAAGYDKIMAFGPTAASKPKSHDKDNKSAAINH